METLFLSEADVLRLLTMEAALQEVEAAFRREAAGEVRNNPRQRVRAAGGAMLNYMAAADDGAGFLGMKLYTVTRTGFRFLVPLFDAASGSLLALIEADNMGCLRTGAATGVATKYMARPDASRVGILGSGHQAPTQLQAVAQVRRLTHAKVFSPSPEHRQAFAERMSAELGFPVEPVDSPEKAVCETDIVIAITSAKDPVVQGSWLAPGTHVNAAGSNSPRRRELDDATLTGAARVAVDSLEQAREEAGDLLIPFGDDPARWRGVVELSEIVAGRAPGRESRDEITVFKSLGVALEDVAVAAHVYRRAREEGVGRSLSMWED